MVWIFHLPYSHYDEENELFGKLKTIINILLSPLKYCFSLVSGEVEIFSENFSGSLYFQEVDVLYLKARAWPHSG